MRHNRYAILNRYNTKNSHDQPHAGLSKSTFKTRIVPGNNTVQLSEPKKTELVSRSYLLSLNKAVQNTAKKICYWIIHYLFSFTYTFSNHSCNLFIYVDILFIAESFLLSIKDTIDTRYGSSICFINIHYSVRNRDFTQVPYRSCGNCPLNQTACLDKHCVSADGQRRGILTANRQMPGPGIQV